MLEAHPDFAAETIHLDTTVKEMRQLITELHSDIDHRFNRIEAASTMKDQLSAYVHAMLRSDNALKIHDIENAISSPYFGRVDFREDGADTFDSFYIGRCKVAKLDIQAVTDILVFDWRDPVATVFYETHGGRAGYEVLGRYRYQGDVRLKRQYKIEDSILQAIVDSYVTDKIPEHRQEALLADPLLIDRLRQGAADKLRDIVTSIQAEQNQIIREPLNQVTVIQGVAGSGKSTVGLHRLSYLLYNEKLDPKKLVVIAPNRIFLDYISELLPGIDAADVRQMVWDDVVAAITRITPVLPEDNRLDLIMQGTDQSQIRLLQDTARLKGSLDFIKILDTYMERRIRKFCLKLKEVSLFDGRLTISVQEQLDKFMEDVKAPYNRRLQALSGYLRFRVNNLVEVLQARADKGDITEAAPQKCRQEAAVFMNKHFKTWQPLALWDAYQELFADKASFKTVKDKNFDLEAICSHSLSLLKNGQADKEDLAPLAYLTYLTDGWAHMTKFDHIVIDEAQDLNAFEFFILRQLSANGSFTIMGDLSQGIHYFRSIGSWDVVLKEVFADARTAYHEIPYSYRSAKEIVGVCNRVMPQGHTRAVPVYESGRKPTAEKILSAEQGVLRAVKMLKTFLEHGANSVGIITKLESDAVTLHGKLAPAAQREGIDCPVHLVSGQGAGYRGSISVLPVHVAKGLEFDAVILWNASETEFKETPLDARLLYVALSRAMHDLHIMYQGNLTPLLRRKSR